MTSRHHRPGGAGKELKPSSPTPPLALPAPDPDAVYYEAMDDPTPDPIPAAVPVVTVLGPSDRNPAAACLAGKPSAVGRRGLRRSLERAAEILTGGLTSDAFAVNWAEVRYQHVSALKSVLMDQGAKPATTNHVLSAVRGTLKEAFLLGLIDAETKERIFAAWSNAGAAAARCAASGGMN